MLQVSPGPRRGKPGCGLGPLGLLAGTSKEEEAGGGKLWRKMIKEKMGKKWGANRQPRERKRLNPDHRMAGWCLVHYWGCRTCWELENLGSALALLLVCCVTSGETFPLWA